MNKSRAIRYGILGAIFLPVAWAGWLVIKCLPVLIPIISLALVIFVGGLFVPDIGASNPNYLAPILIAWAVTTMVMYGFLIGVGVALGAEVVETVVDKSQRAE